MAKATSKELIAEFIGTFLLVFTVGCNILTKQSYFAAVSIACVLMVAIYALGGISGGNFNPAVSFALALSGQLKGPSGGMDWGKAATYMGVQLIAGVVAAFSYAMLFWNAFYLQPAKHATGAACLSEFIYTFMLVHVVLHCCAARKNDANNKNGAPNDWYGLAIAFVIIAGGPGAGSRGAGCFNPAVALGIDVASAGFFIKWSGVYIVMEILGAASAVLMMKLLRPRDFQPADAIDGYVITNDHTDSSKHCSEYLGTFMLVFTVGMTVLSKAPTGAFSIAAALMCMIYSTGDISGGHFNPAVTLAIYMSKLQSDEDRQKPKGLLLYMLWQMIGGAVAASLVRTMFWEYQGDKLVKGSYEGKMFNLGPAPGASLMQVLVGEFVFTFVLCFVVLTVAVRPAGGGKPVQQFALAIGSCVTVGGFAIGALGGGCLNPAVAFGIANYTNLLTCLCYILAEFVGAIAAAGVVKITHAEGIKEAAQARNEWKSMP